MTPATAREIQMSDRDREQELQDHHAAGQKDAANGEYDLPHGFNPFGELYDLLSTEEDVEHRREDNAAYEAGFDNGWKQR